MKIYIEDNEANPATKILVDSDPAPIGYTETTDIVTIEKVGMEALNEPVVGWRDKKNVRSKLKDLVYAKMGVTVPADVEDDTKYDLLTDAEKYIALHWFILGKEEWQTALISDDFYWTDKAADYRDWSKECRALRLRRMEALVFRRMLNLEEAKDVMLDLQQILQGTPIPLDGGGNTTSKVRIRKLNDTFVDGVEGTLEDNAGSFVFESLSDYIDSRAGTSFANNGFRQLAYTFRGSHTADTVADELLNIKDGKA